MKRDLGMIVVPIIAALLTGWTAFAGAASLTILPDPLVGVPGNTVPTSIVYAAEGALVSALQFDVLHDPNALGLTSQTAGSAATAAGKNLDFNTLVPGNTRFVISGLNQNIIGNGSVTDLTFQVSLNAPPRPYPVFLSGILASDPNGNPVSINNVNPPAGVPEPGAVSLLGIGLGAALWRRRKWKGTMG
jgi:hypothetical protein